MLLPALALTVILGDLFEYQPLADTGLEAEKLDFSCFGLLKNGILIEHYDATRFEGCRLNSRIPHRFQGAKPEYGDVEAVVLAVFDRFCEYELVCFEIARSAQHWIGAFERLHSDYSSLSDDNSF